MKRVPTVSFVIPVKNDAVRLERCLRSIRSNTFGGARLEIVVVDNGSTDHSADIARQAGAHVLHSDSRGVSWLRNIGAAHATGEILAFVDADHEITSTWVAAALESLGAPNVAAVGALCHTPIEGTWVQHAYGALRGIPTGHHEVEWLGSGNLTVRRKVFEDVGGFDTSLTTCEDVDLCNRIRVRGGRIMSNARMKNVHYGDPNTLRALFTGELWRGRDNLRVSFRRGWTWRSLPSIVIPLVDVCMVLMASLALGWALTGSTVGLSVFLAAMLVITAGAALKVIRFMIRERCVNPMRVAQALTVAWVYDFARAIALVTWAPHRSARIEVVPAP